MSCDLGVPPLPAGHLLQGEGEEGQWRAAPGWGPEGLLPLPKPALLHFEKKEGNPEGNDPVL